MNIIEITSPKHPVSKFLKEACIESLDQAIKAHNNGADQVELCSQLIHDGLTPSEKLVENVLQSIDIPVKCMLRHRKGNFIYTTEDLTQLLHQLDQLKKYPIAGIVTGALTEDNEIDLNVTTILSEAAHPIPITFHKSIDLVKDIPKAIDQLKNIRNIKYILSSGGFSNAEAGKESLKQMIDLAQPEIKIIPAGSITSQNLSHLHSSLNASIYHGKRIVSIE